MCVPCARKLTKAMLKASYFMLEINEFGSYEAKIGESERVHIEDCEGWLLSGCRCSVAEHWWLKLEVGLTPSN